MPLVNIANLQQFTAVNLSSDGGAIGGAKLVPSCAQIRLIFQLAGAKLGNVILTGRYTGSFAGTSAQANAILAALTTGAPAVALLAQFAASTVFTGVGIRDISVANQGEIPSTVPGTGGTGGAIAVPDEVALVVTKHTALAGRSNRGRMYVPGWSTATIAADNTAVAATITALQNWANTVQNALNASGYQLVIPNPARQAYTGTTGTNHPARPAGSVPVTSLVVRDNHFDSQRRRGLK